MNNKTYDVLKWLVITFVPALIFLISTLGTIYKFDTEVINATISAVTTFIGTLIGISSIRYNKKEGK